MTDEGKINGPIRRPMRTGPRGPQKNPAPCRQGLKTPPQAVCKNCNQMRTVRARGLCWICYSQDDVREKFPKQEKPNRLGTGKFYETKDGVRLICRHCHKHNVNRPRGLCWNCFYSPGVREMYPSTSKYARRGVPNFAGVAALADAPTIHAPGTEGKVACMEARAKARRAIFHPGDARFEGDDLPLKLMRDNPSTSFSGSSEVAV